MEKTTVGEKIGYGIASLGDAVGFGLVGTFLMFFLTNVASVPPAIAGTVTIIGTVWNALFNPVIGYCADKVRTRFGRRRPVILFFSIPLSATMFLLFTNVDIPMAIKPVYYAVMLILFWTCFTGFFVPYSALGAAYTSDYNDRTILRLFASFFNSTGNVFAMIAPTILVDIFCKSGMMLDEAWSVTGGILGIITTASIIITVAVSGKKDPPCGKTENDGEPTKKFNFFRILGEYVSLIKLKPVKYLVFAGLFALVAYAMVVSNTVYFLTYNMGLSPSEISACMLIRALLGAVLIPIVGKLIIAFDKRETLIGFILLGSAGMLITRFTDLPGGIVPVIYMISATICTATYWQIIPSAFYDVCEYDKITTGKKREAIIISFQGFIEAIAVGAGGQLLGVVLQIAGFDGNSAVQSESALLWIENSATVLPLIFYGAAIIALYKYPITKKSYEHMINRSR